MDNQEFIRTVKSEMQEYANRGVNQDGDQFVVWFITKILGEDEGDAIEQYHIGGTGDNKIDIGILDDEHSAVIIAQCKFAGQPLRTTYSADLPEEAKNAHDRLRSLPEAGNEKRREFARHFARTEKPVRILAVGFGKFSQDAYDYATIHKIEIYDFEKIKRRYIYNEVMEQCREPDSTKFQIEPQNHIFQNVTARGLKQWVFLLNVNEIYKLVRDYRDGIFQMDLRFRLEKSAKSGIGKEIYDTILSDDAPSFSILNNGLTLVANRVERQEDRITLISPQIVNGCQTSWAIYDAMEQLTNAGQDISQVQTNVLVKLIETTQDQVIGRITQTTNKQNPISGRDLHSKDDYQTGIAFAFKNFTPPVFYDHREGLWESIVRENHQSLYRVAGRKYRKIKNSEAGQLYLALAGRPYWSKQFKQKIFEDSDYYRVIFRYDLVLAQRFLNDTLDLDPDRVKLGSGVDNFIKDTLFAYAVYQLADALKQLYKHKVNSYPEQRNNHQEQAYDLLANMEFLTRWHFLFVACIHHIVVNWEKEGVGREDIRTRLVGNDWNLLFGTRLADKFNMNTNLETAPILDEEHPSETFALLAKWSESLTNKLSDMIDESKSKLGFTYRWFIDQRADTFLELSQWINREYARGKHRWERTFPLNV